MKKKNLGKRFCDALWKKINRGRKSRLWGHGRVVDGKQDEQYYLKETIKEFKLSKGHIKKLLWFDKYDCWYCLNCEQIYDILDNPPDAKIEWLEEMKLIDKAQPLEDEQEKLFGKSRGGQSLTPKEKQRLKELEKKLNWLRSRMSWWKDKKEMEGEDKKFHQLMERLKIERLELKKLIRECQDEILIEQWD